MCTNVHVHEDHKDVRVLDQIKMLICWNFLLPSSGNFLTPSCLPNYHSPTSLFPSLPLPPSLSSIFLSLFYLPPSQSLSLIICKYDNIIDASHMEVFMQVPYCWSLLPLLTQINSTSIHTLILHSPITV